MQLGEIHDSDSHQVTRCIHEHTHYHRTGGSTAASTANAQAAQFQMTEQQQAAQFSLSSWLQKTLGSGRKLWQGIWGSNVTQNTGEAGEKSGTPQMMAQLGADMGEHTAGVQVSENRVVEKQIQVNPYFQPVEAKPALHVTPVQKLRTKVKAAAGQLTKHLPEKFSGFQAKGSFHAKQQRSKEDLRRRSRYRKDELEIDCILTDESYLMDSYDRKGEYPQLTTKK